MDKDSSSMIISCPKNNGIVIIHDSDQTSDSNTNNKKRPRNNECLDEQVIITKFKGVVPQQNGNWGAQIYANHQRVWLGTFKTATLAAMAYDSAAIKLRTGDLHRNFPWTRLTLQEPHFQAHYSAEAILTMIKDASYQSKFQHFVRALSMPLPPTNNNMDPRPINADPNNNNHNNNNNNSRFATKLLFQKELTPSDVGKLNRLVIPKKFAVKYFPYISEENFIIDSDDVELVFYDKEMTPWRFRYCYWKSSQSYVFTRGWNRFVKDNKLKANDVVTFYSRDDSNNNNSFMMNINDTTIRSRQSFCLIDVTHHSDTTTTTTSAVETKRGSLGITNNFEERRGFRLFGVEIK